MINNAIGRENASQLERKQDKSQPLSEKSSSSRILPLTDNSKNYAASDY
jgi:hypothetical protein